MLPLTHYVHEAQFTKANSNKLKTMPEQGYNEISIRGLHVYIVHSIGAITYQIHA